MSACGQSGQAEEDSATEEGAPTPPSATRDIYKQKPASKLVRVLTVLAYLLSVSLAAILLSVYYVCVWRSPELAREVYDNGTNYQRQQLPHHDEPPSTNNTYGDSGYPLRKTMMTPIIDASLDSPEAYYTGLHVRTRNVIERTIGHLKARFRCLLVHRVLHYEPQVAASIVNACVVLHNICNRANVPVQEIDSEEVLEEAQLQTSTQNMTNSTSETFRHSSRRAQNLELQYGLSTRRELIAHLWERRHVT